MSPGIGGGGFPRIKEILAYLKSLSDTVITAGAGKAAKVNMRDALGNELGTAGGIPLKVDVSGDFPDNVQGAVEQANADVDPLTPGHRIKPIKTGGHANAAAPAAVAENQIADSWFDLNGRQHMALDDGADVTQGASADAAVAAGAAGTISAKIRRLSSDLNDAGVLLAHLEALGNGGAGIDQNLVAIDGVAPSTPGKIDTKTADGDSAALGAIADAAVAAGAAGTLSAKLRRLTTDLNSIMTAVAELDTLGKTGGDGIKQDIVKILGTAPSTAGKLDVKVADGDNVVEGALADAAVAAGAAGSLSAKLRRLSTDLDVVATKVTAIEAIGAVGGAGVNQDLVKIAGTAPSTPGKIDAKVADGDDVALGATADAAVVAGAVGTISAKMRRLSTDIDAMLTKIIDLDTIVGTAGAALPAKASVIALDNGGNAIIAKADAAGNMKVAVKTPPTTYPATGSGAIALTANPAFDFYFHSLSIHFSAAPTTSQNVVVTLNPVDGAAYSTTLYKVDPSVGSLTDILFQTDAPLLCKNGDTITIAYTNTDARTYGARVILSPA